MNTGTLQNKEGLLAFWIGRAIEALKRHGKHDAAMCLEIEVSLLQQGRVSEREAREQAGNFLKLLA